MFCHKCGTEIAEGAAFCHKCGTKVATVETEQSTPRETITEPLPVEQNAQPKVIPAAIPSDDSAMFKAYVDNHVRATTKYQSAEELLNCKPMWFVAICFGVCALIGLLLGARLSDPTYLLIGPLYPFDDPVAIVANDEGKMLGLLPNRGLRDVDGELYDIICGMFFICGLTEDNFGSLTEEQVEKFMKEYETPELFMKICGAIFALPLAPEDAEKWRKKYES